MTCSKNDIGLWCYKENFAELGDDSKKGHQEKCYEKLNKKLCQKKTYGYRPKVD